MGNQKLAQVKALSTPHDISMFAADENTQETANKIIELALSQKSLDTVCYDVSRVSNIAKYVIIASGTSSRHVKGISDKIKQGLEACEIAPSRLDGYDEGEWVVLDYDDVIVHLFFEPKRQYFEFDSLFIGAERMELPEDLKSQARAFKTGLHAI